jgi:SAM-dependent methyltransferase
VRHLRAVGHVSEAGGSRNAPACIWCRRPFDNRATHLHHRTRCSACGAATTDPPPTDEELAAAYGDWYRPHAERRFYFAADAILSRTRGLLAARIDEITPPGPMLDVGAGDGTLIDVLRARGREATGIERNPAREDLRDEPLSEVKGEWAAVIFWHSLEHLPDPGEAIRQAARLLAPGGVVVVAVPNNDSLQARAFGDRWLHLDMPRHLVHLSTRSLRRGFRDNGFKVERVSYVRAGQILIGWLQGLVGLLPGQPDLYQALRRERARGVHQSANKRIAAIAAAVLLSPVAAVCSAAEIVVKRSGTVYMEARLV